MKKVLIIGITGQDGSYLSEFLIEIECSLGARSDLGKPTISPIDNKNHFMRFINDH
ncbi:MAG: hypothetical protein HFH18_00015 [Ruminococcus sp.]|nr:hypothetical protein [Ruminococcus sp.]